jgi:hypothetical protein
MARTSLDVCSFCHSFTTTLRICPECGFCPGCFGGSGECWKCEDARWRQDNDLTDYWDEDD